AGNHGLGHQCRNRHREQLALVDAQAVGKIAFGDHAVDGLSVAADDGGADAPLAQALRQRRDRLSGLDRDNHGALFFQDVGYLLGYLQGTTPNFRIGTPAARRVLSSRIWPPPATTVVKNVLLPLAFRRSWPAIRHLVGLVGAVAASACGNDRKTRIHVSLSLISPP